ncbi:hypothetical protein [Protaetiibacter intestinalis]|uniref:hypothetical protein n=1 Tax=Protaetiibacter intestinalis TaxID=2419774 RepID=UPI001300B08B|nr:hypothetical protein [Protaetiibacter intestinalis]
MLKTDEIDLRRLLDELEEPLIHVAEVVEAEEPDDGFDGLCTQHDGCRIISG